MKLILCYWEVFLARLGYLLREPWPDDVRYWRRRIEAAYKALAILKAGE